MAGSFLLAIQPVLNRNDIGRRAVASTTGPCLYFPPMDESALSASRNDCPHPLVRAPRAAIVGRRPTARLYPAPPGLQGAIAVILSRDARECQLSDEQRLTHFPASPVMSLSWFSSQSVGTVETEGGGWRWRPFGTSLVITGSRSTPTVTWSPTNGYGGMICFTPDVARTLFELDPAAVHDRFVPARDALGAHWRSFLDALESATDDTAATTEDTTSADTDSGVDTDEFLSKCQDAVAGTPAEDAGNQICQQAADALEQCAGEANDDATIQACQDAADQAVKQLEATAG